MITWKPCQTSACVQTGTDEHGNVWVRNSKPGIGDHSAGVAVFTQAEWDAYLGSIRRDLAEQIRQRVAYWREDSTGCGYGASYANEMDMLLTELVGKR